MSAADRLERELDSVYRNLKDIVDAIGDKLPQERR